MQYMGRKSSTVKIGSGDSGVANYGGLLDAIRIQIGSCAGKTVRVVPVNAGLESALRDVFQGHAKTGVVADVVVVSPEWGRKFEDVKGLRLRVGGENVVSVVKTHMATCEWVFLLVPYNFDLAQMFKELRISGEYRVLKQGRLLVVSIRTNQAYLQSLPRFELEDNGGMKIKNTAYEVFEQILLNKYIAPNDSVLQLGGNIGTSCILVDKLRDGGTNVCVEPNQGILRLLRKNKKKTNSRFVIVDGIVSRKQGMVVVESDDLNKWGSTVEKGSGSVKGTFVKTVDFDALDNKYQFDVLFADCEGCLETFFDEYPNALKRIKKCIFEKDNPESCDYTKVFRVLKDSGFIRQYYEWSGDMFHQVYLHFSILP